MQIVTINSITRINVCVHPTLKFFMSTQTKRDTSSFKTNKTPAHILGPVFQPMKQERLCKKKKNRHHFKDFKNPLGFFVRVPLPTPHPPNPYFSEQNSLCCSASLFFYVLQNTWWPIARQRIISPSIITSLFSPVPQAVPQNLKLV